MVLDKISNVVSYTYILFLMVRIKKCMKWKKYDCKFCSLFDYNSYILYYDMLLASPCSPRSFFYWKSSNIHLL